MNRKTLRTIALRSFALVVTLALTWPAQAQDAKTPYPSMAPLDQYLMERNAEITMARSAAPESISRDAEVMVLGPHGYETAVKGKNGFVCLVERSWTAPIDDPDFWNPMGRAPVCYNAPAARFKVPLLMKRTELVLAGRTKTQLGEVLSASLDTVMKRQSRERMVLCAWWNDHGLRPSMIPVFGIPRGVLPCA